jgi:radical SAM protein with 4Fe4S-binding SPASM domain
MDRYRIDGHKLYWHLDRVRDWQAQRLIPPVYMEISPVSYCNHRCIFCGVDFAMLERFQLDADILCGRLKEMGSIGVRSVMFAGEGEPLLHKDITRLIRTAKKVGMDVSMTTNGTIRDPRLWKDILPHLTWARFSVDAGSAKVYDKVHNAGPEAFHKTVDSIREAVRTKRRMGLGVTIGVQFLIIDENRDDAGKTIKLFSDLGVDYVSLKPYSLHPQMMRKKKVVYRKETIDRVGRIAESLRRNNRTAVIFRKDAMEKYADKSLPFSRCRALPFWGYISSRGDFYTCSVFIGDKRFKAGNIYRQDMKAILFGKLRKSSIAFGERQLGIKDECRMNCRMARINEFLEFLDNKPEHINFI